MGLHILALFMAIALLLALITYRLSRSLDWHWGAALLLALIPLAATFFLGLIGLIVAAVFVGPLYKAAV